MKNSIIAKIILLIIFAVVFERILIFIERYYGIDDVYRNDAQKYNLYENK